MNHSKRVKKARWYTGFSIFAFPENHFPFNIKKQYFVDIESYYIPRKFSLFSITVSKLEKYFRVYRYYISNRGRGNPVMEVWE